MRPPRAEKPAPFRGSRERRGGGQQSVTTWIYGEYGFFLLLPFRLCGGIWCFLLVFSSGYAIISLHTFCFLLWWGVIMTKTFHCSLSYQEVRSFGPPIIFYWTFSPFYCIIISVKFISYVFRHTESKQWFSLSWLFFLFEKERRI